MKPDVFIDFRLAGALCGAGEIGHSRILLTPEFGPAQSKTGKLTHKFYHRFKE